MDDFGKVCPSASECARKRRAFMIWLILLLRAILRRTRDRESIQRNLITQVELALRRVDRDSLVECGICTRKVEYILVKLSLIL